jgi:dihydroxy-acid dehydratase
MRGAGPIGYPGGAEVVNMRPPSYLLKKGILALPCIGDGRQSGTSGSPSILNASPEAAENGGLALLKNNDLIEIDLENSTVNLLLSDQEMTKRKTELENMGGYPYPESQSPWQQYFREKVSDFSQGMVLKDAPSYQNIGNKNIPRNNH